MRRREGLERAAPRVPGASLKGAFEVPRPVRVVTAPDGTPHAVIAGGRRRLVLAVREDWLIQDRWWTDAPVDRHYHELLVEPGTIVTVYRDTRDGGWFAHSPIAR